MAKEKDGNEEEKNAKAPHLLHAPVVEVFGSSHSCKVIGLGRRLSNDKEKKQGSPLSELVEKQQDGERSPPKRETKKIVGM